MQKENSAGKTCYSSECSYNMPYVRPHIHNPSTDGVGWVTFVVEKKKNKPHNDINDDSKEY